MSGEPGAATANTVPTHTHTRDQSGPATSRVCVCGVVVCHACVCECEWEKGWGHGHQHHRDWHHWHHKRGGWHQWPNTPTTTTGATHTSVACQPTPPHTTPTNPPPHKAQGTKDLVVCGWHGAQLGAFHPQQQQEEEEEEEERTEREGEGTGRKGEAASTAPVSGGGVMATRGLAPSHKPPTTKPIHHHSHTLTHRQEKEEDKEKDRTRQRTRSGGLVWWLARPPQSKLVGDHKRAWPSSHALSLALPCLGLAWLGHTPFFLVAYPPFFPPFFPLHLHNGHCPIILQTNTLFYHSNFQIISFNSFSTTQHTKTKKHKDKKQEKEKQNERTIG